MLPFKPIVLICLYNNTLAFSISHMYNHPLPLTRCQISWVHYLSQHVLILFPQAFISSELIWNLLALNEHLYLKQGMFYFLTKSIYFHSTFSSVSPYNNWCLYFILHISHGLELCHLFFFCTIFMRNITHFHRFNDAWLSNLYLRLWFLSTFCLFPQHPFHYLNTANHELSMPKSDSRFCSHFTSTP